MIWKEHDFAREVCRQLVELASIRKRVSGDAELLERVQRLEASHRGLLRKLVPGCGERHEGGSLPEESPGAARRSLPRKVEKSPRAPRLDETCGRCGRLLLSGVLGGEDLRWSDGRWCHRLCFEPSPRNRSPRGQLN